MSTFVVPSLPGVVFQDHSARGLFRNIPPPRRSLSVFLRPGRQREQVLSTVTGVLLVTSAAGEGRRGAWSDDLASGHTLLSPRRGVF